MINIHTYRCIDYLENSYLVYDNEGNACLIDPGFYYEHERIAVDSAIRFLNLRVENVLLTHAHIDHVLGCSWAMKKYQTPVCIHSKDLPALKKMPLYASTLGYEMEALPERFHVLGTDDEIVVGNIRFRVFHMPGHTVGSAAFFVEDEKVLFSGDILYHNDIGRTDLPGGDASVLAKSIAGIFAMSNDIKLLPGHGPETTIGYENQFNRKAAEAVKSTQEQYA